MTNDLFAQMKKNTLKADNQLKISDCIKMWNPEGRGVRVMFVGNSMTLHGVNEDIGWSGEYGMAASCEDNDYVHILMSKIK